MSYASDRTAAIKRNIIRFENGDTSHPKGTYTQDNSYRLSLLTQTKDCCPAVVEEGISYDIFVIMGQSNSKGQGTQLTSLETTPVDGVMQLGRVGDNFNKIIPAKESLEHGISNGGSGFPFPFGRTYKSLTGRNVLLVPCGKNGSPLAVWTKTAAVSLTYQDDVAANTFRGVNLYTEALTRTLTAFNASPNNRVCGVLWHQGEANSGNDTDEEAFSMLQTLTADFRSDLFANGVTNGLYLPWMFGEFVPGWILINEGATGGYTTSNAKALARDAIKAIASLPNNGWVTSQAVSAADTVLVSNADVEAGNTDVIHFSTESLRRFGVRYYNVYTSLINGGVSVVSNIVVSPIDSSSLSIAFSPSNGLVSKYILECYINGALASSVELKPYDRKYTLSNVNYSSKYLIAITPYYNNIKGLTSFGSYPSTVSAISGLNMRIFSPDNVAMSDVVGYRTITKIESSGNRYFVNSVINVDHNGNNRLMYVHNGGGLSVGGDVAGGDYSLSIWVKPSSSFKLPIGGTTFNAGLLGLNLNGTAPANTTKTLLSLSGTGILASGSDANNTDFTILLSGSTAGGQYDDVFYQPGWKRSTRMRADGWLHLITTFNNTTKIRTVYINGEASGSDSQSLHVNNGLLASAGRTQNSIFIGTTPGLSVSQAVNNFSIYGFTNDIRMYSKVLTGEEVRNIYSFNY
jgi:hypothetical protein